jgi:putative ABC transport system substrate-binding protein
VNSKVVVDDFIEQGTKAGYQIRTEAVTSSADVLTAAGNLVDLVDAIFIPTDNTVVSGLEGVVSLAISHRIPIYTADTNGINRGAMAAIGYDYYQVGRDTGVIAARILKGEKPADIPVIRASKTSLLFNLKTAKEIGVLIPQDLLAPAANVVQ